MMRVLHLSLLVVLLSLGACSGHPPAPPADRGTGDAAYHATPDGHYRVRRGDTLYAIAFRYGLDWRHIAAWNAISAPYVIYPDQLLRLAPPGGSPPAAAEPSAGDSSIATIRPAAGAGSTTTRALDPPQAGTPSEPASTDQPQATSPVEGTPAAAAHAPVADRPALPAAVPGADPVRWSWPAEGRVVSRFQAGDPGRKGIDIAGEMGSPVKAAADGVVVYSGSGLIGYGELIIVKHSDRMLSAYAHNSRRLVAEGAAVTAGKQIAEMGTNDRNQAVLHFEIRVNGTPEDPQRYLPPR